MRQLWDAAPNVVRAVLKQAPSGCIASQRLVLERLIPVPKESGFSLECNATVDALLPPRRLDKHGFLVTPNVHIDIIPVPDRPPPDDVPHPAYPQSQRHTSSAEAPRPL